jgi:hypothetical protein
MGMQEGHCREAGQYCGNNKQDTQAFFHDLSLLVVGWADIPAPNFKKSYLKWLFFAIIPHTAAIGKQINPYDAVFSIPVCVIELLKSQRLLSASMQKDPALIEKAGSFIFAVYSVMGLYR